MRLRRRVRDEHVARMTAFNGNLLQELATRPQSLPAALAPQMVSNITNIQNVTPTSFVTNQQTNVFQSTHNLHQNTLNFINNTSNRMISLGGTLADAFNGRSDPEVLQPVLTGGPPPPPPPSAARVAIQDRLYTPALAMEDGPPPRTPNPAIQDKKVKPVIRKPKIIAPPKRPAPVIIDPPIRRKPQKNRELLELLGRFGQEDELPSKRSRTNTTKLAIAPSRNRLRVVPA